MSLTCPVCNANFPKSQKNCIPYSICDWDSFTKIFPAGKREDANMFCIECDTNFIATKESYSKLLKTSYFVGILLILVPIAILVILHYPTSYIPIPMILGGVVRILVPQILNASIIELEQTPIKDRF